MAFVMLETEEILMLSQKGINGPAWAIYCALRAHCYLPKKGHSYQVQHFMCFPSQITLHAFLGWPALKEKRDGTGVIPSKPCSRAIERLEELGLVKVYRGKACDKESISARKLMKSKLAPTHRNGKGLSGGRQHLYRLVLWEKLMRGQKSSLSEDTSGISTGDKSVESENTNLSSNVNEGNYIKSNKNTIIIIKEEIRSKINLKKGTLKERIQWFHNQMDRDANTGEPWLWELEDITPAEEEFRESYNYWVMGGTL